MKIIDTHSHLFLDDFKDDLPEVITRARAAGVSAVYLPNIDRSTIRPMLQVCHRYPEYCFPMIGLHPTSVNGEYQSELNAMSELLELENHFVAIGEVGVDLYWDRTFKEEQLKAFDIQIGWAIRYGLPLVIHSRDSFQEVYEALLPYKEEKIHGIFHSFTGNAEEAQMLLEFPGFMLGINGVVTFKNSGLADTLATVSPERIVLETDSPYLSPVPYRGKRNESGYLKEILGKLAQTYRLPVEVLAEITTFNASKVFRHSIREIEN